MMPDNHEKKTGSSSKNVPRLSASLYLAKKMGTCLGRRQVLL